MRFFQEKTSLSVESSWSLSRVVVMRREVEFKMRRDDGTKCEVRVNPFGGKFRFQFKEKGAEKWDYDRRPNLEELELFLDILIKRYHRRRSAHEDVVEAERLLSEHKRENAEQSEA